MFEISKIGRKIEKYRRIVRFQMRSRCKSFNSKSSD